MTTYLVRTPYWDSVEVNAESATEAAVQYAEAREAHFVGACSTTVYVTHPNGARTEFEVRPNKFSAHMVRHSTEAGLNKQLELPEEPK